MFVVEAFVHEGLFIFLLFANRFAFSSFWCYFLSTLLFLQIPSLVARDLLLGLVDPKNSHFRSYLRDANRIKQSLKSDSCCLACGLE